MFFVKIYDRFLYLHFAGKLFTCHNKLSPREQTANSLCKTGGGLRKMSTEGYQSSTDVSWSLRWITGTLHAP